MGAKVNIPSIGRRQYMWWNVQIGVGNLHTELFNNNNNNNNRLFQQEKNS